MSQSCSYFIFNIRIKHKRSLQSAVQFTFKMYILSLNALAFFLFFSFVRVLQECSCYWPWYSMGYGRVLSTSSLSLFLSFSLYSLSLPLSEVAFDWICANTHMANALMWVSCNTKTRKKQVLFSDLKHISTSKKIYFDFILIEGMTDSQSWRVKKFRWFESNQSTAPRFVSII